MSGIIQNFVTIRRTRGDILSPAEYRSIVEMIRGILSRYNSSGFNDAYKDFLEHLVNYNDPHNVVGPSFIAEIIDRTYSIYVKMTGQPVTHAAFVSDIAPTLGFIELVRRIVLNRIVYRQVKNPDGSVPATASVYLGPAWGRNISATTPYQISFGRALTNEDAFLWQGWSTNTTPIPVVFNANNLSPTEVSDEISVFHSSRETPYTPPTVSAGGVYDAPLSLMSNNISLDVQVRSSPSATTSVLALKNSANTLLVQMTATRAIRLQFNGTVFADNIACADGVFGISIQANGSITLSVNNNGIVSVTSYTRNFTGVSVFNTLALSIPTERPFTTVFSYNNITLRTKPTVLVS